MERRSAVSILYMRIQSMLQIIKIIFAAPCYILFLKNTESGVSLI